MESLIIFLVVSLLKENVGTDTGIFKFTVILNSRCSDIHINPADSSVFVLDRINRFDTVKDIFNGIIYRIFAGFQGKTFMSHILQSNNLIADFLLCEFFTGNRAILHMIRTVNTAVYAVIGKIKRSKHHNTVTVKFTFDLHGKLKYLFVFIFQSTIQKQQSFTVVQTFAIFGFGNDLTDQSCITFVFLCEFESCLNLAVVNEIHSVGGHYIVHDRNLCFLCILFSGESGRAAKHPAKSTASPASGTIPFASEAFSV